MMKVLRNEELLEKLRKISSINSVSTIDELNNLFNPISPDGKFIVNANQLNYFNNRFNQINVPLQIDDSVKLLVEDAINVIFNANNLALSSIFKLVDEIKVLMCNKIDVSKLIDKKIYIQDRLLATEEYKKSLLRAKELEENYDENLNYDD